MSPRSLSGPASEIPLDAEAVERFRTGYRGLFGAAGGDDPLYEAVSQGMRHPGMEHWLPLFHDRMETIFDYLAGASLTLDAAIDDAVEERLALIAEYYDARARLVGQGGGGGRAVLSPAAGSALS